MAYFGAEGSVFGSTGPTTAGAKKVYCMEDLLDAMTQVESNGKCNAMDGNTVSDSFSFGPLQISKGYFDIALKNFTEKCGEECIRYEWIKNKVPSVMCTINDHLDALLGPVQPRKGNSRSDKWSRCVVISWMWRYGNRAGHGNIPGSYVGTGAKNAPHNDSPWMNAIERDRSTGLTDHVKTAANRKDMTSFDKFKSVSSGLPLDGLHGEWDTGGNKYGGSGSKTTKGAMDRLCECKGTLKDCELIARLHNGGPEAGHYGDTRGTTKDTKSKNRWDNTHNYWNKVKKELG